LIQQVSIAKAGVTTTLNARTSILAAANPLFGRYNKRYSPSDNINLPAALLSRFDLMFLLLDKTNVANDSALARHVTHVHRFSKHPDLSFEPMSPKFIRAYVSQARNIIPWISPEVAGFVVEEYVNMRQAEMNAANEIGQQSVMTARQVRRECYVRSCRKYY
jgi:DNA replication licensing factor MCM7